MKFYTKKEIEEFFGWYCNEEETEEIKKIVGSVDSIIEIIPEAFRDSEVFVRLYIIRGDNGEHAFLTDDQISFAYIGKYTDDMDNMTWDEAEGYIWKGENYAKQSCV